MYFYFMIFLFVLNEDVLGKNEYYKGHRVYNIKLEKQEQQSNFHRLKNDNVDYLRKPSLQHGFVGKAIVAPADVEWFERTLDELKIKNDIAIEDIYEYLEANNQGADDSDDAGFDFGRYNRYDKIIDFMKDLEQTFINSTTIKVEYIEGAVTDENRMLSYLKITSRNSAIEPAKPIVVIEAGIIPREWITVAVALNIVNALIEDNQSRFLDNFEWIVIPVLNPDGYEYTHTNLRLWQKSRSTRSSLGPICPGVNINRNFKINWRISDSSSSPCSHLFAGIAPFSEPESQFIKNLTTEFSDRLQLYISLQNNGAFIAYPWQYERAASGMFGQHHLLGLKMITSMDEDYKLDVGSLLLGDRASGTSLDYVRDNGILYTFNVSVRQKGDAGVVVPETDIKHIADKIWAGVVTAVDNLIN